MLNIKGKYTTRPSSNSQLSARQQQVADLILQGLTGSEIGKELNVTLNTVKTHRSILYSKLGINSRRELIALKKPSMQSKSGQAEEDNK